MWNAVHSIEIELLRKSIFRLNFGNWTQSWSIVSNDKIETLFHIRSWHRVKMTLQFTLNVNVYNIKCVCVCNLCVVHCATLKYIAYLLHIIAIIQHNKAIPWFWWFDFFTQYITHSLSIVNVDSKMSLLLLSLLLWSFSIVVQNVFAMPSNVHKYKSSYRIVVSNVCMCLYSMPL